MIHIICAEPCPAEFLHQIIILVGGPRRTEKPQGIRAVFIADCRKIGDNRVQGLIPTGFSEGTVAFDKRHGESLLAVDKFMNGPALNTQLSLIHACRFQWMGADELPLQHFQFKEKIPEKIKYAILAYLIF